MLGVLITHTHKKKETAGSDRYVYYPDCNDSITGICICPNSSIVYI